MKGVVRHSCCGVNVSTPVCKTFRTAERKWFHLHKPIHILLEANNELCQASHSQPFHFRDDKRTGTPVTGKARTKNGR